MGRKKESDIDEFQYGTISWGQIFMLASSVIPKIFIPVILVTVWTTLLKVLYEFIKDKSYAGYIFFPYDSLSSCLGTVLSLLLSFRNNSAYDRYWEGRKLWGFIINQARNLSRNIWIGFNIKEDDPEKEKKINLKIGALRLVVALVVSIKHSLRNENKMNYDDLSDLIKHLPRINEILKEEPNQTLKHLPLKIVYYLDNFSYTYLSKTIRIVGNSTQNIINSYTSCQRIIETPIPIIYRIHLKHIVLLYLLTLPLQIIVFIFFILYDKYFKIFS